VSVSTIVAPRLAITSSASLAKFTVSSFRPDAASEITVIEKAHIAADAFTSKRAALKERRVIGFAQIA